MRLTPDQLAQYHRDGFLLLPAVFSRAEVDAALDHLAPLLEQRCPENYREKGSDVVRSAQALHKRDDFFDRLLRDPRLVGPATQILGDDQFYAQQVKVNAKEAFTGEQWQWHYDFAHHHHEDGSPHPQALNVHVFLDDVTEHNGPLVFIPGSHLEGPPPTRLDTTTTSYPLWVVTEEVVRELAEKGGGLRSQTGPAGSLVLFGDMMMHCSPANMSPWPRRIFSVIFNPIANAQTSFKRADHQHHRDFVPVPPLEAPALV